MRCGAQLLMICCKEEEMKMAVGSKRGVLDHKDSVHFCYIGKEPVANMHVYLRFEPTELNRSTIAAATCLATEFEAFCETNFICNFNGKYYLSENRF